MKIILLGYDSYNLLTYLEIILATKLTWAGDDGKEARGSVRAVEDTLFAASTASLSVKEAPAKSVASLQPKRNEHHGQR